MSSDFAYPTFLTLLILIVAYYALSRWYMTIQEKRLCSSRKGTLIRTYLNFSDGAVLTCNDFFSEHPALQGVTTSLHLSLISGYWQIVLRVDAGAKDLLPKKLKLDIDGYGRADLKLVETTRTELQYRTVIRPAKSLDYTFRLAVIGEQ